MSTIFVPSDRLNIVFKISERCNLKCDYCYFFFGGDDTWKQHAPVVGPNVIKDLGAFAARASREYGLRNITLIFHGGEPLLMRRQKFSAMCDTLRSLEDGFRFDFGLQTNGVLVNDEWIALFQKYNVSAGVSLDGNIATNDLHRFDLKGNSSYDRTVKGLRLLQEAHLQDRISRPGLLSVINPEADGAATYRHFVDDLGVTEMSFLTPDYTWDTELGPDVVPGVERFLISSLREWLSDRNPRISIRVFSELLAAMAEPKAMDLVHAYRDDYRNIISVSSNGDLGPEDTLRVLDPRFSAMGLNVAMHDLHDLIESDVWLEQANAANDRPVGCDDCGWWRLCKAGRPINRFSRSARFGNPSLYCSGLQDIYAEIGAFLVSNGVPLARIANSLAT
jgi:uncharacterized protein